MSTIKLNGIDTEYNNIYYISTNGNNNTGDGTKEKPFATYDKAFDVAIDGDLIYFKKGIYNAINLTKSGSYSASYIYDGLSNSNAKSLIIYGEPMTKIIIDNPINSYRDTHAITIWNDNTKVIGLTFDYNVTNKSVNYSRSIFGTGATMVGKIYNCHFIIKSPTSFAYTNRANTMQCINCQFDIQTTLDNKYGNPTKFINCSMNVDTVNNNWGITTDSDILVNISYDGYYHIVPANNIYGIYNADYKWKLYKYLIKQQDKYYSIKAEFYQNGQFSPVTLTGGDTPNDDDFNNNGFDNINDLCNKNNIEESISSGEVLGEGKIFIFDIPSNIKDINNISNE